MRRLRETLADSYVAAVAVAVLLLWSINSVIRALWQPLFGAANFAFTAVAIRDMPYFARKLSFTDPLMIIASASNLFDAIGFLIAAWLLSHWAYGAGPVRGLSECWARLEPGLHD